MTIPSFPLDFIEVSLLITVVSIILLITSEILSSHYGRINVLINKKKLRNTAIIASILFLATLSIRIITLFVP